MSHYDIDYSGLPWLEAKAKAIKDIQDYIGAEMWGRLLHIAQTTYNADRIAVSMEIYLGIRGFPVWAFITEYMPWVNEADYDEEGDYND